MHRSRSAAIGAVAIAAALGLSGCGGDDGKAPPAATQTLPPPIAKPETQPPPTDPLPAPAAFTDVLAKLADPNVPGADKLALVENATPDDGVALDRFSRALRDGGYAPLTFEARDLVWADNPPGNVIASITMKSANPAVKDFTFPMEFNPMRDSWQLTRRTADLLLPMGNTPTAAPPS